MSDEASTDPTPGGPDPLLSVRCRREHHVAAVHHGSAGLVFEAVTGPSPHLWLDFSNSEARNAPSPDAYVDLLEPTEWGVDEVAAWCPCGPWTLSRSLLKRQVAASKGTVHLP